MACIREFKKWQKENPNFMTPKIEDLQEITPYGNPLVIELAKGKGVFQDGEFYGVSVFRYFGNGEFKAIDHALNRPFDTKKEAQEYIKELKEKL